MTRFGTACQSLSDLPCLLSCHKYSFNLAGNLLHSTVIHVAYNGVLCLPGSQTVPLHRPIEDASIRERHKGVTGGQRPAEVPYRLRQKLKTHQKCHINGASSAICHTTTANVILRVQSASPLLFIRRRGSLCPCLMTVI